MTQNSILAEDSAPEIWPIEKLKSYERNARKHPAKQIHQLRNSFREYGQVWPVLVREDGTIICGHGRVAALKAEEITKVRVIVARGWSEEKCRAFGILDNKVALNSEWDEKMLGLELADLGTLGVDVADLGFDPVESNKLMPDVGNKGQTDPDDIPDAPEVPVSRRGDLWQLGSHRLLCGDSTVAEDVAKVLGSVKPHLMVTDPPYGVKYDASWRDGVDLNLGKKIGGKNTARATGKVLNDDRADWTEAWQLFPGDVAYIWHGGLHSSEVQQSLEKTGFAMRAQIIWVKQHFVFGRGDYHWQHEPCWYAVRKKGFYAGDRKQTTVWPINNNNPFGTGGTAEKKVGHSTQKPVECMKRPIENNSSAGQAIYEPFSGSGTTIIAGEMTARSVHAIELNPVYVDVAIKRWQEFTGEKARLESDGRAFEDVAAERLPKAA